MDDLLNNPWIKIIYKISMVEEMQVRKWIEELENELAEKNRFFPDGTAKPDLKPVHIQTTPAGSEKMTKFMNKNHEVKQHHHAENNGDGGKDGKNAIHGSFCRLTYHGPLRRTSFKDVLMTKWMLIFQMDFKRCLTAQKTAFTFREF